MSRGVAARRWRGGQGRKAFMYDGWEVERVADCQMFPLSLLCVFDTQSEGRSDRGSVGEMSAKIEGGDGIRGGGTTRGRRRRCYRMCYLAECCQHLCSSLMRPGGNIMQMSLNGAWTRPKAGSPITTSPSSSSLSNCPPTFLLCPRHCPICLCPYLPRLLFNFLLMPFLASYSPLN